MIGRIVVVGALLAGAAGCSTDGLDFVRDERVTITRPADRDTVRLPVTVEWSVRDFQIAGPGAAVRDGTGRFGVFVDRSPIPSGETLAWLAEDDDRCERDPDCPDAAYFAGIGAFETTRMSHVIERLAPPPADSNRREIHRVTIVLLDAAGARIGESAFSVEFELDRS